MEFIRERRSQVFQEIGKKRVLRILVLSLFIALVWCFADLLSGSLTVNYWHDVICLGFGIIIERLIPWGKSKQKGRPQLTPTPR